LLCFLRDPRSNVRTTILHASGTPRKIREVICRLAIVITLAGCGSHPPSTEATRLPPPVDAAVDAAPLDHDLDRLAARSVEMFDALARVLAAGDDCAGATARLGQLEARYADVIAANARVLHDGRELQLKLALRHYDDRFQAAAKRVMSAPVLVVCAGDARFTAAYERLAGPAR
jgi:hypothetical protein